MIRPSVSTILSLLALANATLGQAVLPASPLPGPRGTASGFGLVEVRGNRDLRTISDAVDVFANGFENLDQVVAGEVPILDLSDFDRRTSGGDVLPGDALPMLGHAPLEEEIPNTVNVAHGRLRVAEAGQYTIQVHGSDGFAMRFPGHSWEQAFSWDDERTAEIDPFDTETLLFRERIGDVNTRGVISLPEGDVDFEFVHFGGGLSYLTGIYFEVTSALGVHEYQAPAQWLPLGAGGTIPSNVGASRDVRLTEPALLVAAEGLVRDVEDLHAELQYARNELPDRIVELDQLIVTDADGVDGRDTCCTRPSLAMPELEKTVIPYGERTTFTGAGVFANFEVNDGDDVANESIELTFALFADDYAELRVVGEDFHQGSEFIEVEQLDHDDGGNDQGMTAYLTEMWQHPLAYAELKEGQYELETYLYQQGFDSGLEVWVATGRHDRFDLSTFYPLGLSDEVNPRPRNVGLQLIDIATHLPGDFDEDGELTLADIDLLSAAIVAGTSDSSRYDLDGNGPVDVDDLEMFLNIAGRTAGDTDLNGEVGFTDFLVLSSNFGTTVTSRWSDGDFNASGEVDFADFLVLSGNFGQASSSLQSVPEPTSHHLPIILLTLLSLRVYGVREFKRKK